MLVLTTMFVGVSQTLPKTSSIKMVDYWLVFNLMIPFVEVLIHTYEDTLRTDETEVNHHGKTVKIGEANGNNKIVQPEVLCEITTSCVSVNFRMML